MTSTDRTTAARARRRPRLLRLWAMVAAAYVLVAAAGSAEPLMAAIAHAQAVEARPAAAQQLREPQSRGGPIPDAPDSPAELIAKAVGSEVLLLAGPPLLLLWFGWDVWFALTGIFGGEAKRAAPPEPRN